MNQNAGRLNPAPELNGEKTVAPNLNPKARRYRFWARLILSGLTVFLLLGCPPFKTPEAGAEGAKEISPAAALPAEAERSGGKTGAEESGDESVQVSLPPETLAAVPRFAVEPKNARPGEPVTVGYSDDFRGARKLQAVLIDANGKRLLKAAFFSLPREEGEAELRAAVLAVPSAASPGNAVIRVESADGIIRDLPFFIDSREFPSETIPLDENNTALRTGQDPQKTLESEQLWAILSRTGTEIYSDGVFRPPVASTRRTSLYGHRRIFEYTDGTSDPAVHAGVDYGVPAGTEVRACAAGRVVLAKYRIVTGNSVVLEHLPGLYSLYYHLDSITVQEGSIVESGFVLGLSGSTGLSTGPHLHWEIRASGENADPDPFLARPVLDKNDILNKLVSY